MDANGLVEYGIKEETAMFRIHVCPLAGVVYVFRTRDVQRLIETEKFELRLVQVGDRITARGYLVPIGSIPGLIEVEIPHEVRERVLLVRAASTDEKGQAAERAVKYMLSHGLIPLPLSCDTVNDRDLQIAGIDLVAYGTVSIQVKLDFNGGSRQRGGTGNCFIQTAERH